jgi:hypothetical protein
VRQVPSNGDAAGASEVAAGGSGVSEPQPTSSIKTAAMATAADGHRRRVSADSRFMVAVFDMTGSLSAGEDHSDAMMNIVIL